ncbi:hypothetical protein R5W23_005504 [Gemmata sp. JC673]|uniref:Uncharacterized protein n=1 Tax=Gemmata algarum TaxID=2975278 RepID=A0ABU5ESV1_9BACT|nr:hypothetical protein [Gemmata algarum]MDY3558411.1 hypothetical protein [Gemmata algarum]
MANELDGIDFGADFEALAQGTAPVAVASVDAISGVAAATVTGVTAAKLIRKTSTGPARSGEVPNTQNEFWLRTDRLGFVLKPVDRITEGDGTVWVVAEVNEVAGCIVRCPVTRKR